MKQITHSTPPNWVGTRYASVNPLNASGKLMNLVMRDHIGLFDSDGNFLRDLDIAASEEPWWSGIDAAKLYFFRGNSLMSMFFGLNYATAIRVEYTFTDYKLISGKGEKCFNGSVFALCGDGHAVFTFNVNNGAVGAVLEHPSPFDSLYVTPDGNVLLSDDTGIHMYNRDMKFLWDVTAHNGHKDVCRDVDGKEVMVWTDNRDNGVYKIPLDESPRTQLLLLPWPVAVDISCPLQSGWAAISTYSLASQYPGQVLKVPLKGSPLIELVCSTESIQIPKADGGMEYQPQPKVATDGKTIVGCSNFGLTADKNYCDVFMVQLDSVNITPDTKDPMIDYSKYAGKSTFNIIPQPKCPTCGSSVAGISEHKL